MYTGRDHAKYISLEMTNFPIMVVVRVMPHYFNYGAPIISLENVKYGLQTDTDE